MFAIVFYTVTPPSPQFSFFNWFFSFLVPLLSFSFGCSGSPASTIMPLYDTFTRTQRHFYSPFAVVQRCRLLPSPPLSAWVLAHVYCNASSSQRIYSCHASLNRRIHASAFHFCIVASCSHRSPVHSVHTSSPSIPFLTCAFPITLVQQPY